MTTTVAQWLHDPTHPDVVDGVDPTGADEFAEHNLLATPEHRVGSSDPALRDFETCWACWCYACGGYTADPRIRDRGRQDAEGLTEAELARYLADSDSHEWCYV